jgi:hypothetical protein
MSNLAKKLLSHGLIICDLPVGPPSNSVAVSDNSAGVEGGMPVWWVTLELGDRQMIE